MLTIRENAVEIFRNRENVQNAQIVFLDTPQSRITIVRTEISKINSTSIDVLIDCATCTPHLNRGHLNRDGAWHHY
jgi:predicted dinucleotide-binding enzyme